MLEKINYVGAYLEVKTKGYFEDDIKNRCVDCKRNFRNGINFCTNCGKKLEDVNIPEFSYHTLHSLFDGHTNRLEDKGDGDNTLILISTLENANEFQYYGDRYIPQIIEPTQIGAMKNRFAEFHKEDIVYLQNHKDILSVELCFGFFQYLY